MALRPLQGPLAVSQRFVLVGVVGALYNIAAAGHVVVTVVRTVQLVRPVTAVVLTVTPEGGVDASAVGAVE